MNRSHNICSLKLNTKLYYKLSSRSTTLTNRFEGLSDNGIILQVSLYRKFQDVPPCTEHPGMYGFVLLVKRGQFELNQLKPNRQA
jgi:hypothetical protein